MAEWRERGYVPDSDEEEEEDLCCSRPGVKTHKCIERQSLHSEALEGREDRNEVVSSRSQQNGRPSFALAADAGEGLIKGDVPPSIEEHEPFLPVLLLNREDLDVNHDVDPMEVDNLLPSSPVAKQLQVTLGLGLKQVSEALRSSQGQRESIPSGSQSSSELSSLDSFEHELGNATNVEELSALFPQAQATEQPNLPSPQPSPAPFVPQRALRRRTQIQLHPYALEDARYQQELKARGLKPVRLAVSQSQQPRNLRLSAGDDASLFASNPMDEDSAPGLNTFSTQDDAPSNQVFTHGKGFDPLRSPLRAGNDDEDLPDLATIFRGDTTISRPLNTSIVQQAHSRQSRLDERRKKSDVFDPPEDENTTHNESTERATFFVPHSPPHSGNTSESDTAEATQIKDQQEATPGRLPTPLLSSENHSRKRAVVELSDSSQDMPDDGVGADAETLLSSEEEEMDKVGKLKAMKRKMKGVLPASWLKLDLKQQNLRDDHYRELQSARELSDGKGVAKPVPGTRPHTGVAISSLSSRRNPFHLDFSDEDLSSDDDMDMDRANHRNIDTSVFDYRSMDVLEDNQIDIMQPARARHQKSALKPQNERQQRISDTWRNAPDQSEQRIGVGGSHRTDRKRLRKAQTAKRQRQDVSPRCLSVLDAPGFTQLSTANQPRFLKVASRRAHRETRKATQNPGGKFLRLATGAETQDINQTLIRWQNGYIHQFHPRRAIVSQISPATSTPLLPQERISNEDRGDLDNPSWEPWVTVDALSKLRLSTDATVQRILFKQQGLPVRSRQEAAPVTSTSPIPASVARLQTGLNLRKPLRNRAGLGSLQRAATKPRTAQIERMTPVRLPMSLSSPGASANTTNARNLDHTSTSVDKLDEQLAPANIQPAQQDPRSFRVQGTRKSKAPRRTQLVVLTESRRPRSSAGLPTAPGSDITSREADIVINIMTTLSQENGTGGTSDGWSILWPPLQTWLELYSDQRSIRTASEKKRARKIFRWCRDLVLEHRWPTAWDDLIRKAAWFFSTFGMVDPFDSQTHPYIGLPPLLYETTSTTSFALSGAGDSTFHVFLNMLAIALTEKSTDAMTSLGGLAIDKKKKTELQSFVNRLYPNNGRLLSEQEEVHKIQLASLWNRCGLWLTLYCYTIEDCRPRLSQLQNLVDFSQSHIKACEVILAVWGVLARFHAKRSEACQYGCLTDVSEWIQSMILRMLLKWLDARKEVEKQLQGRSMEGHAIFIVHTNQSGVEAFLGKALDAWTMAIENCESQGTAAQILGGQQLEQVLDSLTDIFVDNEILLQHMLGTVDQYLHSYSNSDLSLGSSAHRLMLIMFRTLDNLIERRFGSEIVDGKESGVARIINRRLTYDWCLVASSMIAANEKSWDDFLEPAGKCSWERFTDAKRSAQYKVLFVSHIIKANEDVYRDNKFWYLSYWLRALLQPPDDWVFEHELSNAILKTDQYEPMLMNLPFVLQSALDGYELTLADLKHNRTTVLERLVEGIAAASTSYDSQVVDPYALQPPEIADLLLLMMNTMRLARSSLENGSEERNEYEQMICKVAERMERYTSSIVPLDRCLRDADAVAFSRFNLRKRFGGAPPATRTMIISKQEVIWFQLTCQKAAIQGAQDRIREILNSVYVDASDVFETEWYQPKMLAMMQQVFPAYLELALTDKGALIAAPLLRSLDSICNDVFVRAVNMEEDDHTQLLDALYATILSARRAMQRSNVDRAIANIMTFEEGTLENLFALAPEPAGTRALTFSYVVRIARIAISQYREVIRCADLPQAELTKITAHARYVYMFVRSLWLCLQDGQEDHWSDLDQTGWQSLPDSEANKVKEFAAEELQKTLRLDWNEDPAGNYWVMQGRGATQVKREPTGGIMNPKLRKLVKNEMQAYMDMYEGTPGRTIGEAFVEDLEPKLRDM